MIRLPLVPSESEMFLCMILILLAPLAIAGLAMINTGLGRSRSAAHQMLASLCAISVAALVYFAVGFAWEGFAGRAAHVVLVNGRPWDWLAAEPFFFRGLELNGSAASLAACLQLFAVGLAALIPLGSGSDRWRLSSICISTALLAGITFPVFAHWVWGGGWLAQLGINFGLGYGFIDAGGSSTIHAVGGLTALSIAWILGPRRGKYTSDGMPTAIPGHNAVIVLFGCMLALAGWIGLNSAGMILFTGAEPRGIVLVAVNTTLAAMAAALMAAVITHVRFGKPDASLCANGWIGGLVSVGAAAPFVGPVAAIVVGVIAGALITYSIEWFELRFAVDDPCGAISAHALGGLWGVLAVSIFARIPGPHSDTGQGIAQIVGIATLLGFILPLTYGLNWIVDRVHPLRVDPEGEHQGMDLHELGAGAYPEFVTHSDEFTQH